MAETERWEEAVRGAGDLVVAASWREWASPGVSDFCNNSFVEAVRCVAALADVSVVLDVYFGGGCTALSAARGLTPWAARNETAESAGHPPLRDGRRPPEIFSFELSRADLRRGLRKWGAAKRAWQPLMLRVGTDEELVLFQGALLGSGEARAARGRRAAAGALPRLWLLEGSPYPEHTLFVPYLWNPLDVLCLHRQPVDLVVIDPGRRADMEPEWTIVEAVCRPRWAILHNLNLANHAGGWIHQHLEARGAGSWRLMMKGSYLLSAERWGGLSEFKRVRTWALLRRVGP